MRTRPLAPLLLLLVVTGCGTTATQVAPTASSVPSTVAGTPSTVAGTPSPALTPTPTSTATPTSARTPAPTSTAVPTSTPAPSPAPIPSLSASGGGVIAFASREGSEPQVYVMNADGSGRAQVTGGTKGGYEPGWSPDGTKIVFQYSGLQVADLATGGIVRLPLTGKSKDLPNEYLVKPAWSPDGRWIAFINESGTRGDIYLVRPDGTDMRRLTDTDDVSRDGDLVWSPDGKQLAYSAYRTGNIEIYVLDVDGALQGGAASAQLTDTLPPDRNLVTSWSPDGKRLAFSSDRDGNAEIYLMNVDGSDVVRLTKDPASDTEADWSPDGRLIAFTSDRDGNRDVYVLDVGEAIKDPDNASGTRLTDQPGDDVGPAWRPVR